MICYLDKKMKKLFCFWMLCVSSMLAAQEETIDWTIAHKIIQEERQHSQVEELSYRLLDYAGPRLAGSDGMERGYQVARDMMEAYQLSNPRIEFARDWPRGGWDLTKAYAAMTIPYYIPIFPGPVAWTDGTNGLVKSEVIRVYPKDQAELQALKGQLAGKIVLMPSRVDYKINFSPVARRHTEESLKQTADYPITKMQPRRRRAAGVLEGSSLTYAEVLAFVRGEKPAVILHESGEYSVPGLNFHRLETEGRVPCEVNIACENHGLMDRLLANGEKVEMEIDIAVTFASDRKIYNVVSEIPGTDPKLKDQLVLIGGHLDSYHMSPGAGDDGAGFIAMLEAMRILKAIDVKPRRTIRVVFWGGEEVGLHGSSGYVEQFVEDPKTKEKKKEYDKISVYFNSDYGPGKFRGIFTQDNLQVKPIFAKWMEPFEDTGFTTISNRSVGSTDHVPFDNAGIPAFQFIQDPMEWGRHSHRTQDFSDRLVMDDIRHNAAVVAWFVYNAAMRDEMMPRK